MKVNKTYRSLLDKSIASMLAAIEIYNKPNFAYREDSFAILCVNAWELILKAVYLKLNRYKMNTLYEMVPRKRKDGTNSKIKEPATNRAGNPKTLSIEKILEHLKHSKVIDSNLYENIYALIELRDNAIHFINTDPITIQIQELGFATINNYLTFIKNNGIDIDFSRYNFYLMPLAYVNSKIEAEAALTEEAKNYMDLIKRSIERTDEEDDYDIAISIDISFKKGSSFDTLGFKYDENGLPIMVREEDIKKKFPLSYTEVWKKCKTRYSDFKRDKKFNEIMNRIKKDNKLTHVRKLDADNPKTMKKMFYSTNIWKELDKEYTKKS